MKPATFPHHWLNSSSDNLDQSASPSPNRPDIKKALRAIAQTIGKAIYDWLICSSEPIISERWGVDTQAYRVYDPVSKSVYCFASEHEVRAWIDKL